MKLPPVQYLLVLAVSAGMFISGVSVLGYGLYKWKRMNFFTLVVTMSN